MNLPRVYDKPPSLPIMNYMYHSGTHAHPYVGIDYRYLYAKIINLYVVADVYLPNNLGTFNWYRNIY